MRGQLRFSFVINRIARERKTKLAKGRSAGKVEAGKNSEYYLFKADVLEGF